MTRKVYKSAMGKTVDLGALLLQNEQVRAVGNMGVNAAGDLLDSADRVIDQRNRQVQRHYKRQTNVGTAPIASNNLSARKMQTEETHKETSIESKIDLSNKMTDTSAVDSAPTGLAAAIARSQESKNS